MTNQVRQELRRLVVRALAIQEAHDLNLTHYGLCERCGESGPAAIGEECVR